MKRFLALILAALMLLTLAACGSNGGDKDPQPDNDQNQTDEPKKDDTNNSGKHIIELFGYSFTLSDSMVEESTTYGHISSGEMYSLFIYQGDDLDFTGWDDMTDETFEKVSNAVGAAFSFYPTEQTNSTSTKTENDYGETILKVSGTMTGNQAGEGTVDRQFIAFYHVTDENYIRFCVGLPKDDSSASYAALDAAMDTLIENLKKAA